MNLEMTPKLTCSVEEFKHLFQCITLKLCMVKRYTVTPVMTISIELGCV